MPAAPIPFDIKSIETEEFATIDSCYNSEAEIGINTGFSFGINKEEHSLAVKLAISFECDKGTFIKLTLACQFEVEEKAFQKFYSKKSKFYTVPKGFYTHLCVITIGTARGILHTRLSNTKYKQYLLPSMNISEMLKEDVIFE